LIGETKRTEKTFLLCALYAEKSIYSLFFKTLLQIKFVFCFAHPIPHLSSSVDVFAVCFREIPFLKREQLEDEPRPELFNVGNNRPLLLLECCLGFSEGITVMTKEDEITLTVERGDLTVQECRLLRKEGSKHSSDGNAEPSCKVVEDKLRGVE
jgi:hypothetical protein